MPEQFDDSGMDESQLAVGNRVGDLARGYFGDFTEVAYSKDKSEMIAETERLPDRFLDGYWRYSINNKMSESFPSLCLA